MAPIRVRLLLLSAAFCLLNAGSVARLREPKNDGLRFRRQPSLVMPPCFSSFVCQTNQEADRRTDKESRPERRADLSLFGGPSPCDGCGVGPFPAFSLPFPPVGAATPMLYSQWGRCPQIFGCDDDSDENCVQLKITIKNCNGRDDYRRPQVISVPLPPPLPPFLPPSLPLPLPLPPPPAAVVPPALPPPPPPPFPPPPPAIPSPMPVPMPPPVPSPLPSPPIVVSPIFSRPPYALPTFFISVRPYANPMVPSPSPVFVPASPPISPLIVSPMSPLSPPPPPFIVPSPLPPPPPPPPVPIPIVSPFPSPPLTMSPDQIWHPPPMPLQPPLAPSPSPCQMRRCCRRRCANCWPSMALLPCEGNGQSEGQWEECCRRRKKRTNAELEGGGHFGRTK